MSEAEVKTWDEWSAIPLVDKQPKTPTSPMIRAPLEGYAVFEAKPAQDDRPAREGRIPVSLCYMRGEEFCHIDGRIFRRNQIEALRDKLNELLPV